jgi:hypothetical protein
MSTNNTDLFSYLPGLEVSENELLEAELATQQILKAQYPTLDLREGTALRDLAIRPNASLLGLINKALVFYFQNNSVSDVTDATPQIFVDRLMSNWFLERKVGVKAVINARLYFAKQKSVNLYSDIFFSTDGVLKFFPLTSLTYAGSQMVFEAEANQYYLDVDLLAEQAGVTYNITTGSLLYFSNFDPYFLRAEINYLRETAQNIETNTQFIDRAKSAISTRNNINVPSIEANLTDYFTALKAVKTVGFGDPEMVRDQIKVLVPGVTDPVWIHNGGYVDVYCRTPVASSIVQLTTNGSGKVDITGSVFKFERSLVSGGAADDTMPAGQAFTWANSNLLTVTPTSITRTGTDATVTYANHGLMVHDRVTIAGAVQTAYNGTFVVSSVTGRDTFTYTVAGSPATPATGTLTLKYVDRYNALGFSDRQSITVDFGVGQPNKTVSFVIHYHENVDGIQGYLSDPGRRVLCGDLLARGFNLTMLDLTITAYNGPAPDAETCNTVAIAYLDSLAPGQPFVMSDLLAQLYAKGITTIKTPLGVTYTKYWRDLLGTTTGTITDVYNPDDTTNIFMVNSVNTTSEVIA